MGDSHKEVPRRLSKRIEDRSRHHRDTAADPVEEPLAPPARKKKKRSTEVSEQELEEAAKALLAHHAENPPQDFPPQPEDQDAQQHTCGHECQDQVFPVTSKPPALPSKQSAPQPVASNPDPEKYIRGEECQEKMLPTCSKASAPSDQPVAFTPDSDKHISDGRVLESQPTSSTASAPPAPPLAYSTDWLTRLADASRRETIFLSTSGLLPQIPSELPPWMNYGRVLPDATPRLRLPDLHVPTASSSNGSSVIGISPESRALASDHSSSPNGRQ